MVLMRGVLLPTECPICHTHVEIDLRDHLYGHGKDELVHLVLAYIEAIEQDGEP
jgi:hypothetical protein